jgi:hypothetical protein
LAAGAVVEQGEVAYNVSSSYGRRNPTALKVPRFICVKEIEISHFQPIY